MRPATIRLCWMLFLCFALGLSCKRDNRLGAADSSVVGNSAGSLADKLWRMERPDRPLTLEEGAKLMSGFAIDIQPTSGVKGLVFRFRFRDPAEVGQEVPLVKAVMVEKVGEQDVTCELKSADYVPLAEWNYNEAPFGFRKVTCKPLERGGYEVLVQGYGANGSIHIKVDENGAVTRTR